MGFRPTIAPDLRRMDKRLFTPAPMNLRADLLGKGRPGMSRRETLRRIV